jgi:hypothetical protein
MRNGDINMICVKMKIDMDFSKLNAPRKCENKHERWKYARILRKHG